MRQVLLEEFLRDYRDYKRIMNPDEDVVYFISRMVGWVKSNAGTLDCDGEDDIFDAFTQMAEEAAAKSIESIFADPAYWDKGIPDIPDFRKFCRWNKSLSEAVPSGFPTLDRITGGFRPGELTVIGALPGIGKSAFLRNIIRNISIDVWNQNMDLPVPVAYYSPGQTTFQLSLRFILEYVPAWESRTEDLLESRWKLMRLDKAPLHVDDTPNVTARDFRSRAAGFVRKNGVRLIVIDDLLLMRWATGNRKSPKAGTAEVVRCLKETAEELNVPVIALFSLDWKKTGYYSRPQIGDLEYAPVSIEENADVICLMWKRDASAGSETVVTVAKNNKGQTGDVRFNYCPGFSFSEIEGE